MKVDKRKKEQLKAKVMIMITDLITFEKEPGVKGMPTGVYVNDAKRELVRLAEHL